MQGLRGMWYDRNIKEHRKRHVRDIDIEISRYIPVPIRMGLTYLTYG